jgi:hypothetical protein
LKTITKMRMQFHLQFSKECSAFGNDYLCMELIN